MRTSLDRLWLLIALALPGLVALLVPLPAVDLAYQVRVGDTILSTGAIPTTDTFTFTVAGAPWIDQQWLAQVLLALGFRVGGWELLDVLRAAVIVTTSGLLVVVARLRGASLRAAAILSLVAFAVSAPALALRPQLFAVLVFALLLVLVAVRDRHPRWFTAAPLLVVLWANLHGSFVLAPLLLGYAWLDDVQSHRPWQRSGLVLALGAAGTCLTPIGPGVWRYAVSIGADPTITSRVSEWERTSPLTPTGALFYFAVVGVLVAAWRGRARGSIADWAWLVGLTLLGIWAVRGVAWWAPGVIPVAAAAVARPAREPARLVATPRTLRLANAILMLMLVGGIVAALPWWRPVDPLTGRDGLLAYAPSGLAEALGARLPVGARVFAPQTWGSWFEWAAPQDTYFVDSRFELYPADIWSDYDAVAAGGPGADDVLGRYSATVVVLPTSWTAPSGPWTTIYSDDAGAILARAPIRP